MYVEDEISFSHAALYVIWKRENVSMVVGQIAIRVHCFIRMEITR